MSGSPQPADLERALAGVARAIAHSLDLTEVWDRVVEACRAVAPFDAMGISQLEPDGRVRVLAASGDTAAHSLRHRLFGRGDFSPRSWPPQDDFLVLIGDSHELDRSYVADDEVAARGFRSLLRLPLRTGRGMLGTLVLVSRQPAVFTAEHGRRLRLVGEMVALALAHDTLAAKARHRSQRRSALERLVPALTGTLDVRSVFEQVALIAREIVPCDYVSLGLLSEDGRRVRIHATDGTPAQAPLPEYLIPPELLHTNNWDYFLAREFTVLDANTVRMHLLNRPPQPTSVHDLHFDDYWMRVYTVMGVRSTLRATIRLNGEAIGGVDFSSRRTDAFDDEDGEFAMRVAEHVALALAHQRLAEESRRTEAAQARAAQLEERVQGLVQELETLSPHRALGRSRRWQDVLAQATKVAPTETTVLLTGESGTGKEVVARFIHRASNRREGPFVALNCAALPEQLLESELFGHEKGAFTGALAARTGKIEQASGGVLFLDEVGEMSPAVQAKFLRVLQEREYQRLGGTRTLKADVRVLAATNRDLKKGIAQGAFREDLYYRLAVFEICLPPLRERPEDILVLAEAFLEEIGRSVGRPAAGASREVREKLAAYAWPGNVRELRNALERAVILCEGGLITSEHLPITVASAPRVDVAAAPAPAAPTLDAAEREMVRQALARAGNNQSQAARLLGISRSQLRTRMEKHGFLDRA
jgi:transcriptional regulator with GAF, ATPase, and Fis domain